MLVTSITPFGLFVRLPDLQIDGLIHVTALPRDYYHPAAGGTELTGEHTGTTYRLTDQIKVRLVKVDVENRKIDFVQVGVEADPPTRTRRKRRG